MTKPYQELLSELKFIRDRWKRKNYEIYGSQLDNGYIVTGNVPISGVERSIKHHEEQGFEVYVGERAFHRDLTEDPSLRVILVRERQ